MKRFIFIALALCISASCLAGPRTRRRSLSSSATPASETMWVDIAAYFRLDGTALDEIQNIRGTWPAEVVETNDAVVGTAASFNGTAASYITTETLSLTHNESNFTMSAWVRPTNYTANAGIFYQYRSSSFQNGFYITDTNVISVAGCVPADPQPIPCLLNEWQHIAVTYDAGNVVNYYHNGTWVSSYASDRAEWQDINSYQLGRMSTAVTTFQGQIDEAAIWLRTLSSHDVYRLYSEELIYVKPADPTPAEVWSGLVAYYALDGNAYDAVSETTGNWLSGVTETNDVPFVAAGTAAYCDGSALGSVETVNSALLHGESNYTITAWVKVSTFTAYDAIVYSYGARVNGLSLYAGPSDLHAGVGWSTGNVSHMADTPTALTGNWTHIAMTAENTKGYRVTRVYANGEQLGFTIATGTSTVLQDAVFKVGHSDYSSARSLIGAADEVGIWNRKLSPAEIALIYSEQLTY